MASYKENILHGFRKEYFANGALASCKYFVNGVQQSMDLSFFATGKLSVSSSVANNMLHGLTRIFDEVGYLCHEEMWRNGDKAKKCPLENFI
jgi:antitoxin component YwqK of YwqJK toxin-antitoxin module